MMIVLKLCLLVVVITCTHVTAQDWSDLETEGQGQRVGMRDIDRWNYDIDPTNRFGVYNWPISLSNHCNGDTQSPINIQTDRVVFNPYTCPRRLYRSPFLSGELTNNGRSMAFEADDKQAYRLTNVPHRPGIYNLQEFHVHYGGRQGRYLNKDEQHFMGGYQQYPGSEHTINSVRMAGEIHFVFFNNKYRTLQTAARFSDGLVVLSIMVQTVPVHVGPSEFSQFLERNIGQVLEFPSHVKMAVDMNMFFGQDCDFYTYFGSTTTPRCFESVQWVIFNQPMQVTDRAWFQLTRMSSRGDFNTLYGNYRNRKPLHDRIVEANFYTGTPQYPTLLNGDVTTTARYPAYLSGVATPTPQYPPYLGGVATPTSQYPAYLGGVATPTPQYPAYLSGGVTTGARLPAYMEESVTPSAQFNPLPLLPQLPVSQTVSRQPFYPPDRSTKQWTTHRMSQFEGNYDYLY